MSTLEEIERQVSLCADCALHRSRNRAVPGEGPSNALIMFIGEAPGYHEDQQGRPFVGAAGRFLEELLASIGLKREQVFITNVVKCRPPANRDPLPSEISICSKYLEKQLEIIRPKIIVTLGRYSFARFFPKETISKARGRPRKREGVIFYPMFHPAAALHQQSLKRVIEEDIKAIPSLLKEAMESKEPAAPPPQQLSMF
jgi:DNA polymerase